MCSLSAMSSCTLSSLTPLKIAHELGERLHAFQRHRVIQGSTHAADRPVPFQLDQTFLRGLLEEGVVERSVAQGERYVHARAVVLGYRAAIQLARVQQIVQ